MGFYNKLNGLVYAFHSQVGFCVSADKRVQWCRVDGVLQGDSSVTNRRLYFGFESRDWEIITKIVVAGNSIKNGRGFGSVGSRSLSEATETLFNT